MTFSASCQHIDGFTAGHESRAGLIGDDRFAYPANHIEVDNRLSWHLGGLSRRFPDAAFVHLRRDPRVVAESYLSRWQEPRTLRGIVRHQARLIRPWRSLPASFGNGIIERYRRWPERQKIEVVEFLVETINDNITDFLRDKNSCIVDVEKIDHDYAAFWRWSQFQGDFARALGVWRTHMNSSVSNRLRQW